MGSYSLQISIITYKCLSLPNNQQVMGVKLQQNLRNMQKETSRIQILSGTIEHQMMEKYFLCIHI